MDTSPEQKIVLVGKPPKDDLSGGKNRGNFASISGEMRDKFFRLMGGHQPNVYYAHHIYNMRFCEPILDWLLSQGLVGWRLDEWIKERHQGSMLGAFAHVIAEVNKSRKQTIKAGRDYVG